MLNLNWEKINSIILSVTCHGLRNFPLLIHMPLYPFVNCWNPMSYYILSLSFDPPHPTPPHPYMTHPTLPHPFMTHPTPPLYDTPHPTPPYPTPPHPFMTHPLHPSPPHPTPGTFLGTKEPFFMGCFTMSPFGRQIFQSKPNNTHIRQNSVSVTVSISYYHLGVMDTFPVSGKFGRLVN